MARPLAVSSPPMSPLPPLFLLPLAALLGGCAPAESQAGRVRVLASASLEEAFVDLGARFEASRPGSRFELHTAGTPRLVLQLAEGAPAEVFASADRRSMERALESGRIAGEPALFAHGSLVLVTAPGNPHGIEELSDLEREELVVVLCGPEVPAGRYARAALAAAGTSVRSASDEPSVRAALMRVALGEADAAIVYTTDAAAAGDRVQPVELSALAEPRADYTLAVLDGDELGSAFVDFVLGPEGRAVLIDHGFEVP